MSNADIRDVTVQHEPTPEERERPKRVYSIGQIGWGTFFFGPLTGIWLLSRNYKAFGEEGAAFRTMLTGIVATVLFAIVCILLPESPLDKIWPVLIPVCIASFATNQQKTKIEETLARGIPKASTARVILLGAGLLALTLLVIIVVFLAMEAFFPGMIPLEGGP